MNAGIALPLCWTVRHSAIFDPFLVNRNNYSCGYILKLVVNSRHLFLDIPHQGINEKLRPTNKNKNRRDKSYMQRKSMLNNVISGALSFNSSQTFQCVHRSFKNIK